MAVTYTYKVRGTFGLVDLDDGPTRKGLLHGSHCGPMGSRVGQLGRPSRIAGGTS